jgi:uncharacterized membrane protein
MYSNTKSNASASRFEFIDHFRGLVGILMLLGHASYYMNSEWLHLDPLDPVFSSWWQFALRFLGYLCAPGFLMMNGAMVWWAYQRRLVKGFSELRNRWHLIERGLFLVFVQITWVNASWGGFASFNPFHLGIIATIGFAMVLLTLIVHWRWEFKLILAIVLLLGHAWFVTGDWGATSDINQYMSESLLTAGSFNKYPIIPWFTLALLGAVMAEGWFQRWQTERERLRYGLFIGAGAILLAVVIRLAGGFGTIFAYESITHSSFFLDQKYPPSLFHQLWFFGMVVWGVTLMMVIQRYAKSLLGIFAIVGRAPLFFYAVHLAILGIFVKRMDLYYRQGDIWWTLVLFIVMLAIMIPLTQWFTGQKKRSRLKLIRMI